MPSAWCHPQGEEALPQQKPRQRSLSVAGGREAASAQVPRGRWAGGERRAVSRLMAGACFADT